MNVIYNLFLYLVWFLATYYVVLMLLLMFIGKNSLFEKKKMKKGWLPLVSIIVPAFNEQGKVKHTIKSLKRISYSNIEFIIISDGSKDNTATEVRQYIKGDKRFRFVERKENKGKAATLNEGISLARGEFIATMDADSVVDHDIFQKTLPYFDNGKVGAVTVSVLVKNPKSFMHKMFEVEFIIGLSLMLKVLSMFNAVFVTPGPFSMYRKKALDKIGGFDEKSIVEDMEIAYRLQKNGYKIENCMEAKAYCLLPTTFKKITIQRKRWYSGALQTITKHRGMLFNKKYGSFGFVMAVNYMIIMLGIILFVSSVYLGADRAYDTINYLRYTELDLWQRIKDFDFDLLTISRTTVLGILSLVCSIVILITGLRLSRTRIANRKLGVVCYPLMFFLYQFFWLISLFAFVRGKKIKWR